MQELLSDDRRWYLFEGSAFTADSGTGYDVALATNLIRHFDVPTFTGLVTIDKIGTRWRRDV